MKQVIIMRNDLKMGKGKIAAQACHASIAAYKKADPLKIKYWEQGGAKKVVLKVNSLKELFIVFEDVKRTKLPFYLVRDAGHTQIPSATITCLGIGPDDDEIIDRLTSHLKLL